jgi:transposase
MGVGASNSSACCCAVPEVAGFNTPLWTCPRVADVIWREFGVRYHVDHIGRVLHGLGWSPQKPERRAHEHDEAGIQRWVKVEWPRIKEMVMGRRPHPAP